MMLTPMRRVPKIMGRPRRLRGVLLCSRSERSVASAVEYAIPSLSSACTRDKNSTKAFSGSNVSAFAPSVSSNSILLTRKNGRRRRRRLQQQQQRQHRRRWSLFRQADTSRQQLVRQVAVQVEAETVERDPWMPWKTHAEVVSGSGFLWNLQTQCGDCSCSCTCGCHRRCDDGYGMAPVVNNVSGGDDHARKNDNRTVLITCAHIMRGSDSAMISWQADELCGVGPTQSATAAARTLRVSQEWDIVVLKSECTSVLSLWQKKVANAGCVGLIQCRRYAGHTKETALCHCVCVERKRKRGVIERKKSALSPGSPVVIVGFPSSSARAIEKSARVPVTFRARVLDVHAMPYRHAGVASRYPVIRLDRAIPEGMSGSLVVSDDVACNEETAPEQQFVGMAFQNDGDHVGCVIPSPIVALVAMSVGEGEPACGVGGRKAVASKHEGYRLGVEFRRRDESHGGRAQGVIVTAVAPEGTLGVHGVKEGDAVISIEGVPLSENGTAHYGAAVDALWKHLLPQCCRSIEGTKSVSDKSPVDGPAAAALHIDVHVWMACFPVGSTLSIGVQRLSQCGGDVIDIIDVVIPGSEKYKAISTGDAASFDDEEEGCGLMTRAAFEAHVSSSSCVVSNRWVFVDLNESLLDAFQARYGASRAFEVFSPSPKGVMLSAILSELPPEGAASEEHGDVQVGSILEAVEDNMVKSVSDLVHVLGSSSGVSCHPPVTLQFRGGATLRLYNCSIASIPGRVNAAH